MTEVRAKKVSIDALEVSNPGMLRNYTKILSSLKKNAAINYSLSSTLTESKLAASVTALHTAMERLCGKDSTKPRPITKLPMSLFKDFSVGGPLDCILTVVCKDAAKASASISDIFGDNKRSSHLLASIEKELLKQGHLTRPRVFLNKVPVGKINLLSKIVSEHGGSMAPSEDSATHVIDWNEEVDSAPDSADDFIRILEVRGPTDSVALPGGSILPAAGGAALVHWWYYPDSYNEWIPDSEISVGDAPDLASLTPPTRDKWYVCCRFVLDCEVFNEWGNPLDYENEHNEALGAEEVALEQLSAAAAGADMQVVGDESPRDRGSAKKARGRKRFSQLAVGAQDKGLPARDAPILGAISGAEKLQPDAIPPSLRPNGPAQVLEMGSAGTDSKLVSVGAEVGTKRSAAEAALDALAECTLPAGVTEPSWFQQAAVSELETQALGAACTADVADYLKVRNGIINLCAQSPLQYITATECRRKLPGDVSKILQVHEFLNAYALINSRARREARPDVPAALLAASASAGRHDPSTHSKGNGSSNSSNVGQCGWSTQEDSVLVKSVEKHRSAQGAVVDWKAVAAALGAGRAAADCAARFVEMSLSPSPSAVGGLSAGASEGVCDLAAQVMRLAEVAKASRMSSEVARAAQFTVHSAVDAKLQQNREAQEALGGEFVRCKLELLEEKVTLLRGVEAVFQAERARMDVDRRELQVLRAQLALAQQTLLPAEVLPGALP